MGRIPRTTPPELTLVVGLGPRDEVALDFLEHTAHQLGAALERDELHSRVDRLTRLDALGQLAGGIAHDFNNLLMVIQCNADLVLSDLPAGETRDMMEELTVATERASELTRQLLTVARPIQDDRDAADPVQIAEEVATLIRRVASPSLQITVLTEPPVPPIAGSRATLHQTLLNLCVNARDAMPEGGELTMRVRPEAREGRDGVALTITDTGVGMDRETQRRIFEPFFTTKPQGRGTGLGLATVWSVIKASGGSIDVQSALGEGTRFHLWWPAATVEVRREADEGSTERVPEGLRVLLVDDDLGVRRGVQRILEILGCEVIAAEGGAQALELFERHPIDAVLSDVRMPHIDGPALLSRLSEARPGLPCALMTGYADQEANLAWPVLLKPFRPEQLVTLLSQLREGA